MTAVQKIVTFLKPFQYIVTPISIFFWVYKAVYYYYWVVFKTVVHFYQYDVLVLIMVWFIVQLVVWLLHLRFLCFS